MRIDLSDVPEVAKILQNIDRRYADQGGGVLDYPLNNHRALGDCKRMDMYASEEVER
jgi:hypothetical protein